MGGGWLVVGSREYLRCRAADLVCWLVVDSEKLSVGNRRGQVGKRGNSGSVGSFLACKVGKAG